MCKKNHCTSVQSKLSHYWKIQRVETLKTVKNLFLSITSISLVFLKCEVSNCLSLEKNAIHFCGMTDLFWGKLKVEFNKRDKSAKNMSLSCSFISGMDLVVAPSDWQ